MLTPNPAIECSAVVPLQGTNGLFDDDLATTLIAVSILTRHGHTLTAGGYTMELLRTQIKVKAMSFNVEGVESEMVDLIMDALNGRAASLADASKAVKEALQASMLYPAIADLVEVPR